MAIKLTDKQKGMLGSGLTGLTSAVGLATTNAAIKDTSGEETNIDAIQNTQFSSGSFDNLLESFDSNNLARTNYTKKDIRGLSTGEMWKNTLLGTASGVASGLAKGNWVNAAIEGGANFLGGVGGMIASNINASKKAEKLNEESRIANQTYMDNFNNAVQNTQNKMFNNSLLNVAAYGGDLDLSGGFSNGITFINEGGTHESNPLGGVPMGVDQEGTPNLVEEGEVVFNDYVFSKRLKPTKKQLSDLGYSDKYIGLPFSEIAKKFQEASELLPTDKIALDSVNDRMNHLMAMQEEVRMKRRKKENVFVDGGTFNILSGLNDTSSLTGMPYTNTFKYYNNGAYDKDYLDFVNSLTPHSDNTLLNNLLNYYNKYTGSNAVLNDDFISEVKRLGTDSKFGEMHNLLASEFDKFKSNNNTTEESIPVPRATPVIPKEAATVDNPVPKIGTSKPENPKDTSDKSFLEGLRYASPLIHAGTLLNNIKKPDYSDIDRVERRASAIPGSSFTPLGEYISLERFDPNYLNNEILATSAAARRAIQNSGVNAGQAISGILANNYTTNKGLAEGLIQGKKLNNEIGLQEATFNRGTSQANAQMGLQALAMDQQKANAELSTLLNTTQLRNAIDASRSQAISSSLTGIGNDLANIGRESQDRGMLQNMIDTGTIQDIITAAKKINSGKCGGKLNRRKK